MKPCHAKSVACIASVVQQPRKNFYKRRACSFKVMRILVALKWLYPVTVYFLSKPYDRDFIKGKGSTFLVS